MIWEVSTLNNVNNNVNVNNIIILGIDVLTCKDCFYSTIVVMENKCVGSWSNDDIELNNNHYYNNIIKSKPKTGYKNNGNNGNNINNNELWS